MSRIEWIIALIVCAVVLPALALYDNKRTKDNDTAVAELRLMMETRIRAEVEAEHDAAVVDRVNDWLETLYTGGKGLEHWYGGTEIKGLFAVRSWEIVESSPYRVSVRIESSTQGGRPITTLWRIKATQYGIFGAYPVK